MFKSEKRYFHVLILIVVFGLLLFLLISATFPFKDGIFSDLFPKPLSKASGVNIYYISPTGSDSNSGTAVSSPWQTINKVNSTTLLPGDQVLFQGGATFSGKIYVKPGESGTATSPITISSYGTGKAIINSANDNGFYSYDSSGIIVSNLSFIGAGSHSNTAEGVAFYNDLTGGIKLDSITINNIDISGYGKNGLSIGGWNGDSGYSNVKITNTISHDNLLDGMIFYAQNANVNQNIYIGNSTAYNNTGSVVNGSGVGGSGILLGSVNGGVIERSLAYNNGSGNTSTSGPVGIWTYNSNNVTIQYSESYQNHTGGSADGDGFDLDQNVSNSLMQYNYSHDNDGAGYLIAQPIANNLNNQNTIRYNISQNNSRKLIGAGEIFVWGTTVGSDIYNNTIYVSPSSSGLSAGIHIANSGVSTEYVNGLHLRNNVIYTNGGVPLINITSQSLTGATDLLFQGNDYYPSNSSFTIVWGNNTYSSLSTFQAGAKQEILNDIPLGLSVDPGLVAPGTGGIITDPNKLSTLTAYQVVPTSSIIDKGLNLSSSFGISPGSNDYYGNIIPQGSNYDIGANEYTLSSPTPTPTPISTSTPSPSSSGLVGDFNGDGHVNLTDLSIIAVSYGTSSPNIPNPACDLNGDSKVNLTDLSIFAAHYGI